VEEEDPSEQLILEALRLEDSMRRSAEGQERFRKAEQRADHDWMEEAVLMQGEALRAIGVPATHRYLTLLRSTALRHPEAALYVKNNINRDGSLAAGDVAPRVQLLALDGSKVAWPPLHLPRSQPLLVFCGSYS